MNYLSIYFLFISILIVNSAKYDIEYLNNKGFKYKSAVDELNCFNADDPSNVAKAKNHTIDFIELITSFMIPIYEYCEKWNSNLLDKIKTIDDLSENFKTSFHQRKSIVGREINDLIKRPIGFYLPNHQIENITDPYIDSMLSDLNCFNEFILSNEYNLHGLDIYKETQNCEIEYSESTTAYFKFKTKMILVLFDKIHVNISFNRIKTSSLNLKEIEKLKYQLLDTENLKKFVLDACEDVQKWI